MKSIVNYIKKLSNWEKAWIGFSIFSPLIFIFGNTYFVWTSLTFPTSFIGLVFLLFTITYVLVSFAYFIAAVGSLVALLVALLSKDFKLRILYILTSSITIYFAVCLAGMFVCSMNHPWYRSAQSSHTDCTSTVSLVQHDTGGYYSPDDYLLARDKYGTVSKVDGFDEVRYTNPEYSPEKSSATAVIATTTYTSIMKWGISREFIWQNRWNLILLMTPKNYVITSNHKVAWITIKDFS